jgi:hypothetical protein
MRSARSRLAGAIGLALLAATFPAPAASAPRIPPATPRAVCGPGAIPESGVQGRVTAEDLADGLGSRCNLELIGHAGTLAGFRVHRYIDTAGHECAFYDSTPYIQTRPGKSVANLDLTGVHVLDMKNPVHPRSTVDLRTPAMSSPHESLSLHVERGLLAANLGNLVTGPAFVDVYDVKTDCRHPALLSTFPVGVLGHEGNFSPDGNTFWVAAPWGGYADREIGTLTAVDVSDPLVPRIVWTSSDYTPHGVTISPDGNTLYMADLAPDHGLTILDVSEIQARAPVPTVRTISHLTWDTVSLPQIAIPVTFKGRPHLIEVDEFTRDTIGNFFTRRSFTRPEDMVGAARIIDIADPAHPRVISDLRLAVNQPEARAGAQGTDPGAETATGYTAHYCSVPKADDPGIVACSFILSGLRVFDIRDPVHPREVAYFNPPTTSGVPYAAMSAPAFVPERDEIWYTDVNYGFYALRVTNGVWAH